MQVRATTLTIIIGLLMATPTLGQQPAATRTQDMRLLEEVPNYAEILRHQWSSGVPEDVSAAQQSTEHYGRLLETSPQALSLGDCIALAVQHNTDLKIQRLGPLSAATQVRKAQSAFDAFLFGDISRDRQTSPATSPLTTGGAASETLQTYFTQNFYYDAGVRKMFQSGTQLSLLWTSNRTVTNPSLAALLVPKYTTTLGLSLNQPLLRDFGWRYSLLLVEVAQNTEQEAYRQYEAGIATLISQVERAYWGLVSAIENVQVLEQGLTLANELLRQNEGKFNVGTLPRTAVLEAKSEVARRQANLIQGRNQRDNARDSLRAIINYPDPSAGALVMIEPQDKPTVAPYQIDLERSLKTALDQRPELIAARMEIETQGLQRKVAENQLLPRLNVLGAVGVNGVSGGTPPVNFSGLPLQASPSLKGGYGRSIEFLTDGRFYNYSAGAQIEIPIDNSSAKADYVAAKINVERARLSFQKLQEGVTLEIKQAVSNLSTGLESIEATRIARELAEENVRNQQARYDVGLATTKDLLDFQDKLTRARAAEVLALTTYNTDLAEMRRVEGTLLSSRNVLIERVPRQAVPWWEHF